MLRVALRIVLLTGFGLALASTTTAQQPDADQKLEEFFDRYMEAGFQLSPTLATRLGDHRFDDRLDDVSPEKVKQMRELNAQTLRDLPTVVSFQGLSPAGQIDYEILREYLELALWTEDHERPYERDPRIYTSLLTDGVFLLLTQSTLPREENIANALRRMEQAESVLAAGRQQLSHPPRVVTETAIQQNRGAIQFFEEALPALVAESPQLVAVKAAGKQVAAALKRHQTYLEEELLPKSDGDWRLGKEAFNEKLVRVLAADMTAPEVLALAEQALRDTHAAMLLIARQLWSEYFPGEPVPPDDPAGRRETIDRVVAAIGKDHGRAETLVRDARDTVANLKRFITERKILTLPAPDRCQIIEMPEFQRGNSVAYLNPAPPLDSAADSIYAISPPPSSWDDARVDTFLSEYNQRMLQILTIHEAYPGHYVQLEYGNRNPSKIRRVLYSGTFAEGWANYTEQMMLDEGYGADDLALRLMQLKFYLRSVVNALLDHKMHCTDMSDEEALRLMIDEGFQGEGEARLKVVRAKQTSCQLSTYFVGKQAFLRLRQQLQRELGKQFDLAAYHEAVLNAGTIPVKFLDRAVRPDLDLPVR